MKHSHYFKDVTHLTVIDVYRVIELFGVPAGALDHAVKKILCAGWRGGKDQIKDVREARDSLDRWLQMREEDGIKEDPVFAATLGEAAHDVTCFDPSSRAGDYSCTLTGSLNDLGHLAVHDLRFDEARADVIGQNGNDGEHYDAIEKAEERQLKPVSDKQEPPKPGTRRADPVKPKSESIVLPDTSALVDPTGKPKWEDSPNWAMWLAQDKHGVWRFYSKKPAIVGSCWVANGGISHEFNSGDVVGRWQDSLEPAPGMTRT